MKPPAQHRVIHNAYKIFPAFLTMMDDCTIGAVNNISELKKYVKKLSYDISGRFRLKNACPRIKHIEEYPGYADMPEGERSMGYYHKKSNTVYLSLVLEYPATGQNIPAHELGHRHHFRNKKERKRIMARYFSSSFLKSTDTSVIRFLAPTECNYVFHMGIAEEAAAMALGATYFSGELPDSFEKTPLFSQVDFLAILGIKGAESFEDIVERMFIIRKGEMEWSRKLGKQIGMQFGLHVVREHSPDHMIREMITGNHLALIDEALEFNAGLPEGAVFASFMGQDALTRSV